MAGNHLNIGPGVGEASYWDTTGAIKPFVDMLAQKKADQVKKDQDLINAAATLSPDKIRKADQSDYINKYNDWKQAQIQANALPQNSRQRLDALANAQQKFQDVHNFISSSKEEAAHQNTLSNMRLQNPHMFSDDANDKIVKSIQAPMSSPDFIPSDKYTTLERYVDHSKVDDGFDSANKELLKQQQWSDPIQSHGLDKHGNKTGVVLHNERQVEPADLLATHAHMYTLSPDIRASIDKRYANINGDSPQQTMMLRLRQNAIDRGDLTVDANGQLQTAVNEKTKPEFKPNYAPDRFYEHQLWRMEHADGGGQPAQPQAINIPFAGTGVVHAPNYVPLSLPNKNFAGATGVNLQTGHPEKALNSSDSYSIVGAGDFPVSKVTGQIAQPNWAKQHPADVVYKRMVHVQQKDPTTEEISSHLIPYENLPKNVANQKDVRTALAGFNKTPIYGGGQPSSSVKYNVDGQVYDIPSDKLNQFLKAKPKAKRID